ncbi:MAG: universal stress protein UspE [Pseudomonadota bacterium]|nr:universal stress protein UspE [Pseudomonadota bacterium]
MTDLAQDADQHRAYAETVATPLQEHPMLDINHILVVLDRNQVTQPAFERGLWLATSLDADMTLVSSTYDQYGSDDSYLDDATRDGIRDAIMVSGQRWLDTYVSQAEEQGISATAEIRWQRRLTDAVVAVSQASSFDLVIRSTHHHSLLERLFSHQDWSLVKQCEAPVMLVKHATPWRHNRVLACIDATSTDEGHQRLNDNILSYAEHLADHFTTDLHLINTYPLMAMTLALVPEITPPSDLQAIVEEQHRDACQSIAQKYNIADDHLHILEGEPEGKIPECAHDLEADLVVIGCAGRSGLSGVLIGNTAESLIETLESDVLILKPQDGVNPEVT